MNWTCIVITCSSLNRARAVEKELECLKKKGKIEESTILLVVQDPADNIGSGAATLNALVVVTEVLSAQQNYTVLTSDVLEDAVILILHYGRQYQFDVCGKAFIQLPCEVNVKIPGKAHCQMASGVLTNIGNTLNLLEKLVLNYGPGVWVASTDMLLWTKEQNELNLNAGSRDVALFCVPADLEYGSDHGVVKMDHQGCVEDILFCQDVNVIQDCCLENGKVPLVSGLVYLSENVVESLLDIHGLSPLDSCTYIGVDSGTEPLQVSLYFDILVAMATCVSREEFLEGDRWTNYSSRCGYNTEGVKAMIRARSLVWDHLSSFQMSCVILEGIEHLYWSEHSTAEDHMAILRKCSQMGRIHSYVEGELSNPPIDCLLLNSLVSVSRSSTLGKRTILSSSTVSVEKVHIGDDCLVSDMKIMVKDKVVIPEKTVILGFQITPLDGSSSESLDVPVVMGIKDIPFLSMSDSRSTFCNIPWEKFFQQTGILPQDVWDELYIEESRCSLMNACLFPVSSSITDVLWLRTVCSNNDHLVKWKKSRRLSLQQILDHQNCLSQFSIRRDRYAQVTCRIVADKLQQEQRLSILPYCLSACAEGWDHMLLSALDQVAMSTSVAKLKIAVRSLSYISDLLGVKAGKSGGLRSGPGGNKIWAKAFKMLEAGDIAGGTDALRKEREKWLDSPDHVMRAARHYEGALQALIRHAVMSSYEHIKLVPSELPSMNTWVTAKCPARVDLQGGWTDTPPICYEMGGSVVNIAVLVDGKKPIGARARRIQDLHLKFTIGNDEHSPKFIIGEINNLLDYNQPKAHGALLKAAVLCTQLLDVESNKSLSEQLCSQYGGGLELQTWSDLPQGTGLGTSSILAAAVIAVLWTISGRSYHKKDLLHAVLYLEQLLTTGGGWQDQVGGVMGNINRGYSSASFPVQVFVEPLSPSSECLDLLNQHFVLLYTGKVRLAKNLLQNVIRNWYAGDEEVVCCFKELYQCSLQCVEAIKKGDLAKLGELIDCYWRQKKLLAPGCEPVAVQNLMTILKPLVHGQVLMGAGGGGFMCILTKEPNCWEQLQTILRNTKGLEKVTLHKITIDTEGITVTVGTSRLSL